MRDRWASSTVEQERAVIDRRGSVPRNLGIYGVEHQALNTEPEILNSESITSALQRVRSLLTCLHPCFADFRLI